MDADILVGGCQNGQLVIWDLGDYTEKLRLVGKSKPCLHILKMFSTSRDNVCIWDHKVFLEPQLDNLYVPSGYVPMLHWSAESDKEHSHITAVQDLQWLPKGVWVSSTELTFSSKFR